LGRNIGGDKLGRQVARQNTRQVVRHKMGALSIVYISIKMPTCCVSQLVAQLVTQLVTRSLRACHQTCLRACRAARPQSCHHACGSVHTRGYHAPKGPRSRSSALPSAQDLNALDPHRPHAYCGAARLHNNNIM